MWPRSALLLLNVAMCVLLAIGPAGPYRWALVVAGGIAVSVLWWLAAKR